MQSALVLKRIKLGEIENAETDLVFTKHKLLRNLGWENDCSNPAALWLWVKIIDGKRYTLDADTALRFERNMEP